ncbi:hypothetical protein THIARS_60446 [Thiomonas delicata]|uniref:Uncharacterized protein n=1 Tax=Thiomonas delicata TaxID=364030 RepID=A0A238D3A9_THIDL|nr:hypothetical protein THIARS_60446 [Thiomonas delicata]
MEFAATAIGASRGLMTPTQWPRHAAGDPPGRSRCKHKPYGNQTIAQILAIVLLCPLLHGFIATMEEKVQRGAGPRPLQPCRDLAKWLRKEIVVPQTASRIFWAAPAVAFSATLTAPVLILAQLPLGLVWRRRRFAVRRAPRAPEKTTTIPMACATLWTARQAPLAAPPAFFDLQDVAWFPFTSPFSPSWAHSPAMGSLSSCRTCWATPFRSPPCRSTCWGRS